MNRSSLTHLKLQLVLLCLLLTAEVNANDPRIKNRDKLKQELPQITFTENKGQVGDQYYKPRPDVLFGGQSGGMTFHLRKTGISYQFCRVDAWKISKRETNVFSMFDSVPMIPDRGSVCRIDVEWLGCSARPTVKPSGLLPGYLNFYSTTCPSGVSEVQTYHEVLYEDIYPHTALRYYTSEGQLKYDFIIAPYMGYRHVRLLVKGASGISIRGDGSLVMKTPLGEICEGAPVVYQDGRRLPAKWVMNADTLSFDIPQYNAARELIIDPLTRAWGTYYGGTGGEIGYSCSVDGAGNIFLGGFSASLNSTLVATSGAHQIVHAGGTGSLIPMFPTYVLDGMLVKFNSSGARLWGTYYGSAGEEMIRSCAVDASGNVFVCGYSLLPPSGNTVLATPGAQQTVALATGGYNAILAKFNGAGVRQWGTYYGDYGYAWTCATDGFGNVYIAGETTTSTSSSLIATPGAYQTTNNGEREGYLAKFNSSGTRLWGTFYGGPRWDAGMSCAVDPNGNVYLGGMAASTVAIASSGAHQQAHAGGGTSGVGQAMDAFLVKFSSGGSRLWATYYGGSADDWNYACATDLFGNVYLSGITKSPTGTVSAIGTTSAQQPSFAVQSINGLWDGFLVKFNGAGVRQWGTYYGGSGDERIYGCTTDASGNVYIAGESSGPSASAITTPGSYQQSTSGGSPFLAQFDGNGFRQFGTFYCSNRTAYGCVIGPTSEIVMTGDGNNNTCFGTSGSHQPISQGGFPGPWEDAFLVKFINCPSYGATVSATGTVCTGSSVVFNAAVTTTVNLNYLWVGPNSFTSSVANPTLGGATMANAGSYTLVVSDGTNCANTAVANVTILPPPAIVVSDGTICTGQNFTINPIGAASYTIGGGSNLVSPSVTTTYSVSGTSTAGCLSLLPALLTVTVFQLPTITVNSGGICSGSSFTMVPAGAGNYSFSGGSSIVNPTISTNYTVMGMSAQGCLSAQGAISSVTVFPSPGVAVNSGSICSGESFTIIPSGANTYTFSSGSNVVSPNVTTNYSVIGTSTNGCTNTQAAVSSVMVHQTPTLTVNSGSICNGQSFIIVPSGANSYTISGGSFTVSPPLTTSYSITGSSAAGCISTSGAISNVTVNPSPTLVVTNGTICAGQTFTINVSGANSYTISGGTFIVSPSVTTSYSISGSNTAGCTSASPVVGKVTANPIPTVIVNSGTICAGQSFTINPTGANTYTYSGGSAIVNPSGTTSYSITGTDANGCVSQTPAVCTVMVNQNPIVSANTNATLICFGETITLMAVGANSYSWSSGQMGPIIIVTPSATTLYTVLGFDANGCTGTASLMQLVEPCVGMKIDYLYNGSTLLYPNPTNGLLTIQLEEQSEKISIEIIDVLGKLIFSKNEVNKKEEIDLSNFANGVYFVQIINSKGLLEIIRLVKE